MKCAACDTKKGKRNCLITDSNICPICCATQRQKDLCSGCVHYEEPKRYYNKLPYYTPAQMNDSFEYQDIAIVIEVGICTFDYENNSKITDVVYINALELLQNIFYFQEAHKEANDPLVEACFLYLLKAIEDKLSDISHDVLSKIIGALYFVTNRRTCGGREHLVFLHGHVGCEVEPGVFFIS